MPLIGPDASRTPWPPLKERGARIAEAAAWYAGDPAGLASIYGGAYPFTTPDRSRLRFWARRSRDQTTSSRAQLHVPLASDIAACSASLLMGTMPQITWTADDAATNLIGDQSEDLGTVLAEAAEICAALGGVWLRPAWDFDLEENPFLTVVHPDAAWPTWRYGRLVDVTFWTQLDPVEGDKGTWRHLETHWVDGVWRVRHQLFHGSTDTLGVGMPLAQHPQTSSLAEELGADSGFALGLPMLGVAYVPNMRPNRRDRFSVEGRPDIDGSEGLLDALDEAWTSWIRDLRLAKARLVVPETYLDTPGRGRGQSFDLDREIFTPIDVPTNLTTGYELHLFQPEIRFQEHEGTVLALVEQIVGSAGYAPQEFGLHIEGRAESGTALRIRRSRTYATVDRKRRYWTPGLTTAVWGVAGLARTLKGGSGPSELPSVDWPEDVDLAEMAETVSLIQSAAAASTETRVRWLHPDWTDQQIVEEAGKVRREQGLAVPDPLQLGVLP